MQIIVGQYERLGYYVCHPTTGKYLTRHGHWTDMAINNAYFRTPEEVVEVVRSAFPGQTVEFVHTDIVTNQRGLDGFPTRLFCPPVEE